MKVCHRTCDNRRPKCNCKFYSVWSNLLGRAPRTLAMEEQMDNYGLKDANIKSPQKKTDNVTKSNKCNQCDFVCVDPRSLSRHLKTHSWGKSNKCNQCDYASSRAGNSRTHFKMHSEEKSNKCNQWDYACSDPSAMRKHVKDTVEISHTNATNVTLRLLLQVVWGHI